MKKNRLIIGLVYLFLFVAVVIVMLVVKNNQYSIYLVMNNDGCLISSNDITRNLFNSEMLLTDADYKAYPFGVSDIVYKKSENLFMGEDKVPIFGEYPLFVNNDSALLCLTDSATLISDDFESARTYNGLYISEGLSFNPDMERAYREEFMLLSLSNGLYVNTKTMKLDGSFFVGHTLNPNTIVRFMENEIRYYTINNGLFTPAVLKPVDSSTMVTIDNRSYGYYDFLEMLGLYEKGELLEKEHNQIEDDEDVLQGDPIPVTETTGISPEGTLKNPELADQGTFLETSGQTEQGTPKAPTPAGQDGGTNNEPDEDQTQKGKKTREDMSNDTDKQALKAPKPAESAKLPPAQDLVNPVDPSDMSYSPEPPVEEKEDNSHPELPNWVKPEVKLGNISTTVYNIISDGMIIENSQFLYKTGVSFSIYQNDTLVMKKAYLASGDVKIGPLHPDTDYKVEVVMDYLDKYGVKASEVIKTVEVHTRPLSELVPLKLNWTNGDIFYSKIQLQYLSITNAITGSTQGIDPKNNPITIYTYSETAQYISRMEVIVTEQDNPSKIYTMVAGSSNLAKIRIGEAITYESTGKLPSDTEFTYEFRFYDRIGNILPIDGTYMGSTHTCKQPPIAEIKMITNEVKNIVLDIAIKNPDLTEVVEDSIFFSIYDRNDNPIATTITRKDSSGNEVVKGEYSEVHALDMAGNRILFEDLLDYEVYKIRVFCDYNINDNKGMYHNAVIAEMSFTTMPISALGFAFFNVELQQILDNKATVAISLDTGRTDDRLLKLITDLDISFTESNTSMGTGINVKYYKQGDTPPSSEGTEETVNDGIVSMTEQEIAHMTSTDVVSGGAITYIFEVENLKSSTKYDINIKPRARLGTAANEVSRNIDTYYTPKNFTTMKKTPVVVIDAIYASTNSIKLYGMTTNDPDGAIVTYPVTVCVYDENMVQIDAHEIQEKGKTYDFDIINLERNKKYTIRFFAKVYNNGFDMTTMRKNQEIYYEPYNEEKKYLEIVTKEAVDGDVSLFGMDENKLINTLEIPAKNMTSHTSNVTLYNGYRFTISNKNTAKYSMLVDFGDVGYNSFQIGYSYSSPTNYRFYLADPDTNPGLQPFATCLVSDPTRGTEYCRWTELQYIPNGVRLTGSQRVYVVAQATGGSTSYIHGFWGVRYHKAVIAHQDKYYANLNVSITDPRKELGDIPSYKLKIYRDGVWVDTRYHEWSVNPDGTYTLYMYQEELEQQKTLVDTKVFSGQERICDTNFYYEVDQGYHTYKVELSVVVYNYEIRLDQETFTCENRIIGIRTADELFNIRYGVGITKKYYVLNDITLPLGLTNSWYELAGGQAFNGELDFRGHTLTNNSTNNLIGTLGYFGKLKNLVLTYGENWGKDVERQTTRIVANNYGKISNIYVSRNNGNVQSTYVNERSAICNTNYESGTIENFVVELKDPLIATNYSAGVCVYNKGTIRNGYIYGKPVRMTPQAALTEDQYTGNTYLSSVVSVNRPSGIIENVYSLVDVETRPVKSANDYAFLLAGINDGLIRNSFTAGDVYYGGEIRQDFGPAYRNRFAGASAYNTYYYSEKDYRNTNNPKITKLVLHDILWYKRLFDESNSTVNGQFDYTPVTMGYYPHVVWPACMPSQAKIPLPMISDEDQIDIVDTNVIEQGIDYAKAVITFDNPNHLEILDFSIDFLKATILSQEIDGKFYRVTVRLTQAAEAKCYSSYEINGFTYSLGFRNLTYTTTYEAGKKPVIKAEFYKPITTIEGWYAIKNDYHQNYRLEADLDFAYIDPKTVVIPANVTLGTGDANFKNDAFTGKLDGNGHKISFVDTGTYGYVIGKLTGTVKNLTIEQMDASKGNGQFKGFIGRILEGGLVDNVHVLGMNAVSYAHCGAIAGDTYGGTVVNSSAHDITIVSSADGNYTQFIGGLIGKHRQSSATTIYANMTLQNCYVDGVDIKVLAAGDCGGVGGLIGYIRVSAELMNVYAVNGRIETAYKNAGGLIGSVDTFSNSESSYYKLQNYYVDVDIISNTERCGGVIGYCMVADEEQDQYGLALGTIATSIPNPQEVGYLYGYNKYLSTAYHVYGYEYSILNGEYSYSGDTTEKLTRQDLCNPATYQEGGALYWTSDFKMDDAALAQGIMPKLYKVGINNKEADNSNEDDSNKLLPYQRDYYLENNDITIEQVSSTHYPTGNLYIITIVTKHAPNLTVTGAAFNGLKPAGLADPSAAEKIEVTSTGTTLQYVLDIEGYYDSYYLTEIHYTDETTGVNKVQKTYLNVGIEPQYLEIGSASEWNNKMMQVNFGQLRYNILITGDLDFTSYGGTAIKGVIVNHLESRGGQTYTIKGINMESSEPFVKAAYGNVKHLKFEDITLRKSKAANPDAVNGFGLFEAVGGNMEDVSFSNIKIEAYNSAYVGIVALAYGMNSNIKMSDIKISGTYNTSAVPAKLAVGGYIARLSGSGGVKNTIASDIIVKGRSYVGGIVGTQEEGRYLWDITVNNEVVYSIDLASSYIGGVIGYANLGSLSDVLGKINVKRSVVLGTTYIGGVVGCGSVAGDATMTNNIDKDKHPSKVSQAFITGSSNSIGGIAGQGVVRRAEVRNSYIYGSYLIGGMTGNGSAYFDYVADSVIGTVYDRTMEDTSNNSTFQNNVNAKIAEYKELKDNTTDPWKSEVYNEAIEALELLTKQQRITSWSAKSWTGDNNTRIGGISGKTISVMNSMVVNSSIGSYGAVSVGGIVPRTELSSYNSGTYRIMASGVQNCEVYGAKEIGGIVGTHLRAYIDSCYCDATVTASGEIAGGIAGRVKATNLYSVSETPYFRNIYFTGTVTAPTYVAGIAGKMEQDLYNVNKGLLMAGNVVVTNASGIGNYFVNKQVGDARKVTNSLVYENGTITFGTNTRKASDYFVENPDLLLADEINTVSTAQLRLKATYTGTMGWSTDEGISSSNYSSNYFKYNGLTRDYMPYLNHAPSNNYEMASSIRVLPFQEGYQQDSITGKAAVDADGVYLYKYESYDGGIPIPGSTAGVVGRSMLKMMTMESNLPGAEFYAVDADLLNIEFNQVNESAFFEVKANGQTIARHNIDRRTFTLQYDFRSELEVIVSVGDDEYSYEVWPETVSRNVMTWGSHYYYVKATEIGSDAGSIPGQFTNLYAGHALNVNGDVIDVQTQSSIRKMTGMGLNTMETPLHSFTYEGNPIQTFKNYSLVNGMTRDNLRLYVKNGKLSAFSSTMSMIYDSLLLDEYNGKEYCTILKTDGVIADMTDSAITMPEEFDNQDIQYMTNNLNCTEHILLVRYYDGGVAGFNYITGELLLMDNARGGTTTLIDKSALKMRSSNVSMTDFATLYVDAMVFADYLEDIGWAEVDGVNLTGGTYVSAEDTKTVMDTASVALYLENSYVMEDGSEVGSNVQQLTEKAGVGTDNSASAGQTTTGTTSETGAGDNTQMDLLLTASEQALADNNLDHKTEQTIASVRAALATASKYGATEEELQRLEVIIYSLVKAEVPLGVVEDLKKDLQETVDRVQAMKDKNDSMSKDKAKAEQEGLSAESEKRMESEGDSVAGTGTNQDKIGNQQSAKKSRSKDDYIAVYDEKESQYVLYDKNELLTKEDEKLETVNEKVKRSGHMIDYKAKQKADIENAADKDIYGYLLLSFAIAGIAMLLSLLAVRKQKEVVE